MKAPLFIVACWTLLVVAQAANSLTITCPSTAIDVSLHPVNVTCQLTAYLNTNISSIYVYAGPLGQAVVVSTYVYPPTSAKQYSGAVVLMIPQYAPNGTWSAGARAFDQTAQNSVTSTTMPKFVVKPRVNDTAPPALEGIAISAAFTVDPCGTSNYVTVIISDNYSGVTQLKISYVPTSSSTNYPQPPDSIVNFATPVVSSQQFKIIPKVYVPDFSNTAVIVYVTLTDAANNVGTYAGYTVPVYSSQCPPSQYIPAALFQNGSNPSPSACRDCPAHMFSSAGWSGCCTCVAGTSFDPTKVGYQACPLCPAGYYGNGATANCTKCPAGTIAPNTGTGSCTPCPCGTGSSADATSCMGCPSGSTSTAGICSQCPKGTYSTNGLACVSCSAGSYAPNLGQTQCNLCPVNTYSSSSRASACTACPSGTTAAMGSNSVLECM